MNTLTNGHDATQSLATSASADERLLIVAGPGTGKTHVSALRLAHLVSAGLLPSQILVLSFSRSAVRTLIRRVELVVQAQGDVVEDLRHLSVRTFDSWTFRLLRMSGLQPDQLLRNTYEENIDRLVRLLSDDLEEPMQGFLMRIRHIIIDESQDIGGVRFELVKALLALLAPPDRSGVGFTILGDDAQAIYQFAARAEGAKPPVTTSCMQHVREQYPGQAREIELKKNYRATPEIAEATRALHQLFSQEMSGNERLREMENFVTSLPVVCSERLSPSWLSMVPSGSLAILTRTNGEALRIATQLSGNETAAPAIPVTLHMAGYTAPVPAWIAVLLGPVKGDTVTRSMFAKIHAHSSRRLGDEGCLSVSLPPEAQAWLRLVRACGLAEDATSLAIETLRGRMGWPDAFPDDQLPAESSILISTIHQSKGMEFDAVVLLQNEEGPDDGEDEQAVEEDEDTTPGTDPNEEASVLFVAVTRAARFLGIMPRKSIFKAYKGKDFGGGARRRLRTWWNGWVNIEAGIAGDISPSSFVNAVLHEDAANVVAVQEVLVSKAAELRGRKVLLCKSVQETEAGRRVFYNIHLQDDKSPGLLLGQTSSQLTYDLLKLLGPKYALPPRIMNLRIGTVITIAGPQEVAPAIPEPYRTSRLWLGISLCGTGDFRPFKAGAYYHEYEAS
jgi:DNA helicase-2/ATP-dependent DNA helicase PcrA